MTAERRQGVETERLRLVPWSDDHLDDFARICADPEVMRFISAGRPLSREDVEVLARRTLATWDEHGFGPWSAIEKASGRWVGRIGINLLEEWPGPDRWEIGYELAPEFWGRGLATEGAKMALRYAWERTPLERIVSVTVPGNAASRRVMEKCGLTFQGEIVWKEAPVVWYAIDRPADSR
jgi:RimJ/RimL family protein N-acetyltransferase